MNISMSISIGEIIQSSLTFLALIGAFWLYITQTALNKKLLETEDFVETFSEIIQFQGVKVGEETIIASRLHIINASKTPLRLKNYTYNGSKRGDLNYLLYKTSTYYIELPDLHNGVPYNEINHVSIILKFADNKNIKKYKKEIEVQFNNTWTVKESPLKSRAK